MSEQFSFLMEDTRGITKALLLGLAVGAVIIIAPASPGLAYVFKALGGMSRFKNERRLKSAIKRLEKQELLGWEEKDGEVTLTLTEKGKKRILKYKLDELELKRPTGWDGWMRVVVFDIPEERKTAREIFREKLKQLGFHKLQKSVFVIPFECKDEVDFLRHTLEISEHVHYMKAKDVSNLDIKLWFSYL